MPANRPEPEVIPEVLGLIRSVAAREYEAAATDDDCVVSRDAQRVDVRPGQAHVRAFLREHFRQRLGQEVVADIAHPGSAHHQHAGPSTRLRVGQPVDRLPFQRPVRGYSAAVSTHALVPGGEMPAARGIRPPGPAEIAAEYEYLVGPGERLAFTRRGVQPGGDAMHVVLRAAPGQPISALEAPGELERSKPRAQREKLVRYEDVSGFVQSSQRGHGCGEPVGVRELRGWLRA